MIESNDELLSNTETDTVEPVAERNSPPEEELKNYDDIVEESSDAAETPSAILNESTILPPGLQLDTCNKWKSQYPWLLVQDGKLYCKTCKEVAVIPQSESASCLRIEKQWVDVGVQGGNVRGKERKKMSEKILHHSRSKSHAIAAKVLEEQSQNKIISSLQQQELRIRRLMEEKHQQTIRTFRSAYLVAKEDLSFKKHPKLFELQELNGVDMGTILFSDHACQNIIQFLAKEMKQELITYLVGPDCHKFSIIVDESTTISNRTVLISYVRVVIRGVVQNVFWELCELKGTTASDIAKALYDSFVPFVGLETVKKKLLALGCDGASVMLGCRGGVARKFAELIERPNLPAFHCVAHRLELTIHDAIKSVTEINHFSIFLDKLYVTFSRSPKSQRALEDIASETSCNLRKVGKIFDVRWCFSSYSAVNSLWENYSALYTFFSSPQSKLPKMANRLTRVEFVAQLCVIRDCLFELKALSLKVRIKFCTVLIVS